MEASPRAAVIDLRTGEVIQQCEDCANYERELRAKRRRITLLENQLADKRASEVEAEAIVEVLSYWRDRCMKRPESVVFAPGGRRWEKVRDRLAEDLPGRNAYTPQELHLAVDGALISPFHNGTDPKTKGKQYLDAVTIFRDAETVGAHIERTLKFEQLVGVLPSTALRALIGLNMEVELERCDCGHERLLHVGLPELEGREVCKRCGCGDFTRYGT